MMRMPDTEGSRSRPRMVIPPTVLRSRPKLAPSRHTRQLRKSWNRRPAARSGYATRSSEYRAALDTPGRCKRYSPASLKRTRLLSSIWRKRVSSSRI
jgi:hypothetical protein